MADLSIWLIHLFFKEGVQKQCVLKFYLRKAAERFGEASHSAAFLGQKFSTACFDPFILKA
jgi:hypothetical protein